MSDFKLLDYCYHTHTFRCGHAFGTDEEYVVSAIENGFKTLGFTDHIFFPGLLQPGMRGNYEWLADYVDSIRNLTSKYANQIKIYLGFEAEYYPQFDSYYKELLSSKKIDYLILGQHFELNGNRFGSYYGSVIEPVKLRKYVDEAIIGMSTGLFKYVAHPDLYMNDYYPGWNDLCDELAHRLCQASLKYDIPLELNMGNIRGRGLRQIGGEFRYGYPHEKFWEVAGKYQVKTIIGIDAHAPNDFKGTSYKVLYDLVEKYKLNYIDKIVIIK